jgi:RNA polymerase II subunit A C-terminal domain phosphatase
MLSPNPGQLREQEGGDLQSPVLSDTVVSGVSNPTLVDKENNELVKKSMLTQNSLALEAQVEERPLARKQEELQAAPGDQVSNGSVEVDNDTDKVPESQDESGHRKRHKAPAKALLKNNDFELQRVKGVSSVTFLSRIIN